MRASRPRDSRTHCFNCFLRREICVCPILPSVPTQTEFLILRHIWEAHRPSNTGRLVTLAMPNSRIIDCGGGDRTGFSFLNSEELRAPDTWLLWPDGHDGQRGDKDFRVPRRIVVLDATWHQARRLFRRTPLLQRMPRLALPAPAPDRKRLRNQRRADGMSTLEAVAAAVAVLEGHNAAAPLERLYDEVVRRTGDLRWGTKSGGPDFSAEICLTKK